MGQRLSRVGWAVDSESKFENPFFDFVFLVFISLLKNPDVSVGATISPRFGLIHYDWIFESPFFVFLRIVYVE